MSLLSLARKLTHTEKELRKAKPDAASAATKAAPESREQAPQRVWLEIYPITTEKSVRLQEQGVVTFRVPERATKGQVAEAVQQRYGTVPRRVRIVLGRSKRRRRGATIGQTAGWKKAYVVVDDVQAIT